MRKLFKNFEVSRLVAVDKVRWQSLLQIHNMVVQILFSVTFALSCTMFELIIFEIVGFLDTRYRGGRSVRLY